MRIWSVHPKYLDAKGIVALWRETLLARKVLLGGTKGYRNHPQLIRFRESKEPIDSIDFYLQEVWKEACNRGYNFNSNKFNSVEVVEAIPLNEGQLDYERKHLLGKLESRDPEKFQELREVSPFEVHPLFELRSGGVEEWEKV